MSIVLVLGLSAMAPPKPAFSALATAIVLLEHHRVWLVPALAAVSMAIAPKLELPNATHPVTRAESAWSMPIAPLVSSTLARLECA